MLKYVTITTAEALYAALGMSIIACIIAIVLAVMSFIFIRGKAAREKYILPRVEGVSFGNQRTKSHVKLPVYECPSCGIFMTDCANTVDYKKPRYCPKCGCSFIDIEHIYEDDD